MLNRTDPSNGEAVLIYGDHDFITKRNGRFVRCAVSGAPIELEDLRYWSVDLQEAYRGPEEALQRWRETAGKRA
jgi:hypothetical protein